MSDFLKRTWAEVDLNNLRDNYKKLKAKSKNNCKIMAIVKADAYGHGDKACATTLDSCGADWFGVSNIEEALQLREAGISKPVLIFGHTPVEYVEELVKHKITQTVFCEDYAMKLAEACKKLNAKLKVHIKIDTGMGRLGFPYCDSLKDASSIDEIYKLAFIREFILEGIYTHFSSADDNEEAYDFTKKQFNRLNQLIERLKQRGVSFKIKHCCNSAAYLKYEDMHLDMVRLGITLYGLFPSPSMTGAVETTPVMTFKTIVSMIKTVPAGSTVGYGRTFKTSGSTVIATLPVGYADGYSRLLSNKGYVLIKGQKAKILGNVCMDQLMVDITGLNVETGDEVVLFGKEGEHSLPLEELASLYGTINYEIASNLGKRVPRIYVENGKRAEEMDLYK